MPQGRRLVSDVLKSLPQATRVFVTPEITVQFLCIQPRTPLSYHGIGFSLPVCKPPQSQL